MMTMGIPIIMVYHVLKLFKKKDNIADMYWVWMNESSLLGDSSARTSQMDAGTEVPIKYKGKCRLILPYLKIWKQFRWKTCHQTLMAVLSIRLSNTTFWVWIIAKARYLGVKSKAVRVRNLKS